MSIIQFSDLMTKQLRNDLPNTTHTAGNANVKSTSEVFRVDLLTETDKATWKFTHHFAWICLFGAWKKDKKILSTG